MTEQKKTNSKFVGIEIPSGVTRRNFYFLYTAAFLVNVLMVFPAVIQPVFLKEIIGIPDSKAGSINSLLQNLSQVASLFLAGYVGFLSDRLGRRIMLMSGAAITGLFIIGFGYSKELGMIVGLSPEYAVYVTRFILGVALIFTWPHFSPLIADYTNPSSRGKAMAMYGMAMGLGTILSFGAIGQMPRVFGIYNSFLVAAGVAFLASIVIWAGLVDRMSEEKKKQSGRFKELMALVKKSTPLKVSYAATFIGRADTPIIRLLMMVWLVTAAEKHGLTPVKATGIGGLIMMGFAVMAMLSNVVAGPLVDKIGRVATIILSMASASAGFAMLYFVDNPFSFAIALPIGLIGFGMSGVVIGANTLAADASPRYLVGTVMGGLNTVQSVGLILLLQAAGVIRDVFSTQFAFMFKAILNVLFIVWLLIVRKKCEAELTLTANAENLGAAEAVSK